MQPATYIREMRKASKQTHELRQTKNALPYMMPTLEEEMRYCSSKEKYLRPTYQCQSNAPEIIAMANRLGAFQKSDREYVENCYQFINRNIDFDILQYPSGALKTLYSGKGLCLDTVSLFIAFCRTAGIPARYVIYKDTFVEPVYELLLANRPLVKKWYDSSGHWIPHVSAETFVDGRWLIGEFYFPWALAAGLGLPIASLGDDASGTWCFRLKESTLRYEAIPHSLVMVLWLGLKIFGALFAGAQARINEKACAGEKFLNEIGEEEYNLRIPTGQSSLKLPGNYTGRSRISESSNPHTDQIRGSVLND
jgi:hypothetical protein